MTWNNPSALYWLLLLGIPILIHLLFFKRYRTYYFSNLKQVAPKIMEQNKIRNIKKWIILLLRICFFGGLILALAGPQFSKNTNTNNRYVILFDNSISNSETENGISYFEMNKRFCLDFLKALPSSASLKMLAPNSPFFEQGWLNPSEAQEWVDQLALGMDFFNFELLEQTRSNWNSLQPTVICFTDGQKHSGLLEFDNTVNTFVPHKNKSWNNIWVDAIRPLSPVFIPGKANTLYLDLERNFNESESTVTVEIKGKNLAVTETFFFEKGSKSMEVPLELTLNEPDMGIYSLTLQSTDLLFDNQSDFILSGSEPVSIALGKAFQNPLNAFFKRLAYIKTVPENGLEAGHVLISGKPRSIQSSILNSGARGFIFSQEAWDGKSELHPIGQEGFQVNFEHPFFRDIFIGKVKNPALPFTQSWISVDFTNWDVLMRLDNGAPGILYREIEGKPVIWCNASSKDTQFWSDPLLKIIIHRMVEKCGAQSMFTAQQVAENPRFTTIPKEDTPWLWNIQRNDTLMGSMHRPVPRVESELRGFPENPDSGPSPLPLEELLGLARQSAEISKQFIFFLILALVALLTESVLIRKETNV